MSVDLRQATLESLLNSYFTTTPAKAASEQLRALIASNQRYTLDRLLRDHRLRGQGVMEGPESEGRAATDRWLKGCSMLEIASYSGVIPDLAGSEWAAAALTLLMDTSVRHYYEDFYPECNPQLFRLRLQGTLPPSFAREADNALETSASIFQQFAVLDHRFTAELEQGPSSLFLQLLDGWSIHCDGSSYQFDCIHEMISKPECFVAMVCSPVDAEDPRSSGVHGFVAFLAFCRDLEALLKRADHSPLLQSRLWHHYGYWFHTMAQELQDNLSKALDLFLEWQPPSPPAQVPDPSADPLDQDPCQAIQDYVRETKAVLLNLASGGYGEAVHQALAALAELR